MHTCLRQALGAWSPKLKLLSLPMPGPGWLPLFHIYTTIKLVMDGNKSFAATRRCTFSFYRFYISSAGCSVALSSTLYPVGVANLLPYQHRPLTDTKRTLIHLSLSTWPTQRRDRACAGGRDGGGGRFKRVGWAATVDWAPRLFWH